MEPAILLKTFEMNLGAALEKLRVDVRAIRGNRPSVDLVGDIAVNYFDQWFSVKQLGSLAVAPPRGIHVTVWDKGAVGAVAKAIEGAKVGLSVSVDGNTVRATLSALSDERREELSRLVKKEAEGARIRVRSERDDIMKKLKNAEGEGAMSEDALRSAKDKAQKAVDETNRGIEKAVAEKLAELQG